MLREKPEFYKEEIRCGYTVDEKTKRVWAVQLEMLDEVERICKANGLKYFADSGTLIGAIRHEGYIPWDDDIDLVMLREDYDKFVQIAPKWLKEDLVLQTVYTEKNYLRGHAQIRNSKTCGCNEEDKKAGYNCGIFIDIFPLDGMPKTEKERKNWAKRSSFIGPCFIPGTALIIMKMQRFLENFSMALECFSMFPWSRHIRVMKNCVPASKAKIRNMSATLYLSAIWKKTPGSGSGSKKLFTCPLKTVRYLFL